jgi:hypothetical protein
MNNKSKFQTWYNEYREHNYDAVHAPMESKVAWDACKKEVLKQLKGFEGEYVCDVIDRIKDI